MNNDTDDQITLKIGEYIFYTTRTTLRLKDGFLRTIADTNEKQVFIDRDGKHFRIILNYIRGSWVLPKNTIDLEELLFESDFYCLDGLKEDIKEKLNRRTPSIETILSSIAHQMQYMR